MKPLTKPVKATPMLAFHNDPALRDRYVERIERHQRSGDFLQNYGYYKHGKGSLIGCITESESQNPALELEREAGIPEALGHLADQIFEKLPDGKYQTWPKRFFAVLRPGADLTHTVNHWIHWLLTIELPKRYDSSRFTDVGRARTNLIHLIEREIEGRYITPAERREIVNETTKVTTNLNYAAAYADTHDTLAAVRVAYTINYAARTAQMPRCATHMVICAGNCGIFYETLTGRLTRILTTPELSIANPSQKG